MRILFLFFVLVQGALGYSQSYGVNFDYHRDFDSIARLTTSKKSTYHYKDLLKRFDKADTSLTTNEVLALLIGQTQQDNYYPYEMATAEQSVIDLAVNGKYNKCLQLCDSILKVNPVNFTALLERSFVQQRLGLSDTLNSQIRFVFVMETILKTGEGTYNSPMMVIGPSDGQQMVRFIFGLSIGDMGSGEDVNGYSLDILEVLTADNNSYYMYFNIEHAVKKMFRKDILKKFEKLNKLD